MIHTNAIAYGFLANAFLGMLQWVRAATDAARTGQSRAVVLHLRRLAGGRAEHGRRHHCWAHLAGSGVGGEAYGRPAHLPMSLGAQGLEWGETPFWIDPVALLGLALVAVNFLMPIAKAKGPLYVTLWYFMAAFVWTFLTYAMGNFLPEYALAGNQRRRGRRPVHSRPGGLVRDAAGLGADVLHRADHAARSRSGATGCRWSASGAWRSSIRCKASTTSSTRRFRCSCNTERSSRRSPSSSWWRRWSSTSSARSGATAAKVFTNLPIRWFYTGMIFYFITCFQCALQVTLDVPEADPLHRLGRGPRAPGDVRRVQHVDLRHDDVSVSRFLLKREWYSRRLCEWHFWLSAVGRLRDVPRPDSGRRVSGLLLGVAAAVGRVGQRFAAVLDHAGLRRAGDVRRLPVLPVVNILMTMRSRVARSRSRLTNSPLAAVVGSSRIMSLGTSRSVHSMFESKAGILFIAGIGFFAFAFLSNVVVPMLMFSDLPEKTAEEVVNDRACCTSSRNWRVRYPGSVPRSLRRADGREVRRGLAAGPAGLHRRRLLALPQPVRAARLQRIAAVRRRFRNLGVPERTAAAGDVRHASRRSGSESRRRPARQRLARRSLLPTQVGRRPIRRCPSIPGCSTAHPDKPNNAVWH